MAGFDLPLELFDRCFQLGDCLLPRSGIGFKPISLVLMGLALLVGIVQLPVDLLRLSGQHGLFTLKLRDLPVEII